MYYVYALSSKIKRYIYVGLTSDINRRVEEHFSGRLKRSTGAVRPLELIFLCGATDRVEAREIEKYFKSGVGKEFIKGLGR